MTQEGFNRLKIGDRVRYRGRLFTLAYSVPASEGPLPGAQPYFVRVTSNGSAPWTLFRSAPRTFRPDQIERDTASASPAIASMPAPGGSAPETQS